MESGGWPNPMNNYPARGPRTGIVIKEANANNPTVEEQLINPQASFKRDADQYMPIANVIRIMRRVLPAHAKIADDAKETIQECVSEFISFVTSEANERCHREYRKTITPNDVLSAMVSLGFDNYVEPLTVFLENHQARGATHHQAPYARRGVLRPTAQIGRPPGPVPAPAPPQPQPQAMTMGYVPTRPYAVDHRVNCVGLPPDMSDFFMGNRGGGEGSSGGAEFDLYAQQFK